MTEEQGPDNKKQMDKKWLPIGIALGIVFGAAIDNMGVGIAIGLIMGAALANRHKVKK